LVNDETVYQENDYDIAEPVSGQEVSAEDIDCVFVPLMSFDTRGYRVGYGKGFYDRYLVTCRQDVIRIGFSYFDPVDCIKDINEFDVPLNICITPNKLYEF
jgi:5-formyltetrahydrofolate cyclo-ligase